ncbi:hypothetical protein WA171_001699 [Blastocystis sp. BT1]
MDSLKPIISPSILSADFSNLERDCRMLIANGADWLHVDIMDGHFVPNLTIGAPVVKSLRKHLSDFMDCHLMVENPEKYIIPLKEAGANMFNFHVEAAKDPRDIIRQVHEAGMLCAMTIKPKTSVDAIKEFIPLLDMVLVMTVEPGFGGQKFMESCLDKVAQIRALSSSIYIEVDGGVSVKNAELCASKGANVLVSGSAIFGASDIKQYIREMKNAIEKHLLCVCYYEKSYMMSFK